MLLAEEAEGARKSIEVKIFATDTADKSLAFARAGIYPGGMMGRMFAPNLTGWRAQYDRMLRGLSRLRRGYGSSVEYQDDLQHFFQDCWHLKEWIKNDPESGIAEATMEQEVKANTELRIVGDLATACKHLNHARRDTRGDGEGAYATRNDVTVHLAQNRPADITYLITMGDGRVITAQDLIEQAVTAWDVVLRRLRLIA